MRPVVENPDPRPDKLDLDGSRERESARRIDCGTGDIFSISGVVNYLIRWMKMS